MILIILEKFAQKKKVCISGNGGGEVGGDEDDADDDGDDAVDYAHDVVADGDGGDAAVVEVMLVVMRAWTGRVVM